jgi:hypothetical protein
MLLWHTLFHSLDVKKVLLGYTKVFQNANPPLQEHRCEVHPVTQSQ